MCANHRVKCVRGLPKNLKRLAIDLQIQLSVHKVSVEANLSSERNRQTNFIFWRALIPIQLFWEKHESTYQCSFRYPDKMFIAISMVPKMTEKMNKNMI